MHPLSIETNFQAMSNALLCRQRLSSCCCSTVEYGRTTCQSHKNQSRSHVVRSFTFLAVRCMPDTICPFYGKHTGEKYDDQDDENTVSDGPVVRLPERTRAVPIALCTDLPAALFG